MEIRLSKIIKGCEETSVSIFDFQCIERVDACEAAPPSTPKDHPPQGSGSEQELEARIQQRLLDAERKALELEKEGYEKGYEQGMRDGMEYGRKSMVIAQEHLQRIVSRLEALPGQIIEDYKDWFVQTILRAVRYLVRKELDAHPEILLQTLESLLYETGDDDAVTVFLHPKDIGLVQSSLEEEGGPLKRRSLQLKPDPELERGGCRVETPLQVLDAALETQLALLERALSGADEVRPEGGDPDVSAQP